MNFKKFGLKEELVKQIATLGYKEPTPIQEQSIPLILEGRDMLGLAKTGTGKTAAFSLPMLQKLEFGKGNQGVRGLIIAPTRELAEQINESIMALGKNTKVKTLTVYGGVSATKQIEALKKGVDIVIGCPGRILDHINEKHLNLSKVEFLVLDEADHMLDMGFLRDIEKIIKHVPAKRQTLFFSATMPEDIRTFASKVLKNPATVEVAYKEQVALIEQTLYYVKTEDKKAKLLELLKKEKMESVIIFSNGKHKSKNISSILNNNGYKSVHFQGNLSQNQRDNALGGFRKAEYKFLVATDIAARGLDIPQVTHVINFDLPRTAEAFTHRSGRTGRANKTGKVISFACADDKKVLGDIMKINKVKFSVIEGDATIVSNAPKKIAQPTRTPRPKPVEGEVKTKEATTTSEKKKGWATNKAKLPDNNKGAGMNKTKPVTTEKKKVWTKEKPTTTTGEKKKVWTKEKPKSDNKKPFTSTKPKSEHKKKI